MDGAGATSLVLAGEGDAGTSDEESRTAKVWTGSTPVPVPIGATVDPLP